MNVRILLFFTLFSINFFAQLDRRVNPQAKKFEELLNNVVYYYVDSVNDSEIVDAAIEAMLEKLDPHSTYIPKEDVDGANERINGSFVGVGITFQILKDTIVVVSTVPGGPSEKIGILAGDKIVMIENENVTNIGIKNTQVRERLLGEKGTKVKVAVLRRNVKKPMDFVITRDKIALHSIDASYMINKETGYIKLSSFSKTTTEEMEQCLKNLKEQGMKNLIFDIQDNGGGLLYAAKTVSDQFLSDKKLIVYSEGKAQSRQNLYADTKGEFEEGKLIILVNENSASASEIVSGAIQDWDRGLIVGRRTFGKGLVQRPIDLADGSQVRLTIARYYTPTGRFIQKPYDDLDAYKNDYMNRFMNGELSSADSIKVNDSLLVKTMINKRNVFGGGGILPDVFVPLDTTKLGDYYKALFRGGVFNTFSLSYVDKNRDKLKKQYKDFTAFNHSFNFDKDFMKEFLAYTQKELPDLKYNEEEFKKDEELIKLRLKAMIAQDSWGKNEFFQIVNSENDALQKALSILENGTYNSYKLAE